MHYRNQCSLNLPEQRFGDHYLRVEIENKFSGQAPKVLQRKYINSDGSARMASTERNTLQMR